MIYTFYSPWDREKTKEAIKAAVTRVGGKTKEISPGSMSAKWRSTSYATLFPTKFTFYIGDGIVRAVSGTNNMQMIPMRFKVRGGFQSIWNTFIISLLKLYPDVDFGLRAGDAELVAAEFIGDGTEQVFVSTTHNSPSLSGAAVGGLLFGTPGAIIGSSYGTSRTTGKMATQFSGMVLVKARYSNGLLAEGKLSKKSPVYHEIIVNMSSYSSDLI